MSASLNNIYWAIMSFCFGKLLSLTVMTYFLFGVSYECMHVYLLSRGLIVMAVLECRAVSETPYTNGWSMFLKLILQSED